MPTLIIRKPAFMRNEGVMLTYLKVAESISKVMCNSEISITEKYDLMKKISYCLDRAAEAGGFFSTDDFMKWMSKKISH